MATLRRQFIADIKRRFKRIRDAVSRLVRDDALDLSPNQDGVLFLSKRWAGYTIPHRITAFADYVSQLIATHVGGDPFQRWIEDGYLKGLIRAFDKVKNRATTQEEKREFIQRIATRGTKKGIGTQGSKRTLNQRGIGSARIGVANARFTKRDVQGKFISERALLLSQRLRMEMKGATDVMSQQIAREVVSAFEQGKTPDQLAEAILDKVDIADRRAATIARTELVRAHAEGQLDAMEEMDIDEITALVEWSAEDTACSLCQPLEGLILRIADARGMLPRHPNCRCIWLPVDDKDEDPTPARQLQSSVKKSVREEKKDTQPITDTTTDKDQQKAKPTWAGEGILNIGDITPSVIRFDRFIRDNR